MPVTLDAETIRNGLARLLAWGSARDRQPRQVTVTARGDQPHLAFDVEVQVDRRGYDVPYSSAVRSATGSSGGVRLGIAPGWPQGASRMAATRSSIPS